MLQRQTAYKVQAKDILEGQAVFDGERFSAIESSGKRILRVNLVGNVIDKYVNSEKKYCTLTVDDGSGQIRIKGFSDQFDLLNGPEVGDTLYIVGMLRYFNNELYIMPEIIRKSDPIWLSVRSLELGKRSFSQQQPNQSQSYTPSPYMQTSASSAVSEQTKPQPEAVEASPPAPLAVQTEKIFSEENKISIPQNNIDSPKLRTLNIIKKEGEIDLNRLGAMTGITYEEMNSIINDLLAEGEIYELKPGYLCAVN